MRHLFICREYPPSPYPAGGIGTYVRHICQALAEAGDTVHVIAHRWAGAPRLRQVSHGGRLTLHRVALDDPMADPQAQPGELPPGVRQARLIGSDFPSQAFAWQAALLAERLIEFAGIDTVEAQEWEAPLYYLQWRRLQGLGPLRRPPLVVHLHSSTEKIFEANGWSTQVADYAPATAMEAFSIRQADAVLAPSCFIAAETTLRHGLDPSRVLVIPYPLGTRAPVARPTSSWQSAGVGHIGRLELRKGMLEWAAAVGQVGTEHPALRAEFAGADTPRAVTGGGSVRADMLALVPPRQRRQLRFHGQLDSAGMARLLGGCFAAVVPSRWENFPNACVEAMQAGLPILCSPCGGMVEMVEDGVSGWIAADGSPAGLAHALRRALATPVAQRQRMGAAAAAAVQRICAPDDVVRRHRAFKAGLCQTPRSAGAGPPSGAAPHLAIGLPGSVPGSAMSLAVKRPHMALWPWLKLCPPDLRRSLPALAWRQWVARTRLRPPLLATPHARADPAPAPPASGPPQAGLVSVIVAAYNAEQTISETLRSVLAQTWDPIEVIVVDDGSRDNTAACVLALAAADSRIRLLRQTNRGVATARNLALAAARGEFVAPLDADDVWAPHKLRRQVECLRASPADTALVYCWWFWIDADGRFLDRSPRWHEQGWVLDRLAEVNFIGNASVPLFTRDAVLRQGGYDARLRDLAAQGCEDWDLALKVAEHHRVAVVPELLVGYRRHPASMSGGCDAMWASGCRVLAELAARQPALPANLLQAGRGQFALHLAGVSFWSGRGLQACRWAFKSRAWGTLAQLTPRVLGLVWRRMRQRWRGQAGQSAAPDGFKGAPQAEAQMPYDRILARRWARRAASMASAAQTRSPSE